MFDDTVGWIRSNPELTVLWAGLLVRAATLVALAPPMNPDSASHLEYLTQIHDAWAIPVSEPCVQTYHPPLYHIVAAMFWGVGREMGLGLLSLLLSCATLALYYHLLVRRSLISPDPKVRTLALAFCAFSPQFVQFGLFISNDTLANFLGALVAVALYRFCTRASVSSFAVLIGCLIAGLSTKYSFLPYPIVVLGFAGLFVVRGRSPVRRGEMALGALLVACLAFGFLKPLHNAANGLPAFVSNIDPACELVVNQLGTYRGFVEFHAFKLWSVIASPVVSSQSKHSFPTMLYATFWMSHWNESIFAARTLSFLPHLVSLLYLVAVVPTVVFLIGVGRSLHRVWRVVVGKEDPDPGNIVGGCFVVLLLTGVGLLYAATLELDVWSIAQSRLVFPAFLGGLFAFARGHELVQRAPRNLSTTLRHSRSRITEQCLQYRVG